MTPTIPLDLIERAAQRGVVLFAASNKHEREIRLGGAPFAAKCDGRLAAVFDNTREIEEWLANR